MDTKYMYLVLDNIVINKHLIHVASGLMMAVDGDEFYFSFFFEAPYS